LPLIADYKGKDEEKGYLQFLFNINRNWNVFVELVLSTTANRTNKMRKGLLEHYHSNSPFCVLLSNGYFLNVMQPTEARF
jgi:hypothetical protein